MNSVTSQFESALVALREEVVSQEQRAEDRMQDLIQRIYSVAAEGQSALSHALSPSKTASDSSLTAWGGAGVPRRSENDVITLIHHLTTSAAAAASRMKDQELAQEVCNPCTCLCACSSRTHLVSPAAQSTAVCVSCCHRVLNALYPLRVSLLWPPPAPTSSSVCFDTQREQLASTWQQRLQSEVEQMRDELLRTHAAEMTTLVQHHAEEMAAAVAALESQDRLRAEVTGHREEKEQQQHEVEQQQQQLQLEKVGSYCSRLVYLLCSPSSRTIV